MRSFTIPWLFRLSSKIDPLFYADIEYLYLLFLVCGKSEIPHGPAPALLGNTLFLTKLPTNPPAECYCLSSINDLLCLWSIVKEWNTFWWSRLCCSPWFIAFNNSFHFASRANLCSSTSYAITISCSYLCISFSKWSICFLSLPYFWLPYDYRSS